MHAEALEDRQRTALLLVATASLEGEQHPRLVHLEFDAVGEVVVEEVVGVLGQAQMRLQAKAEVTGVAVARHRHHELDATRRQRRLHVQRAVGFEHPLQPLKNHSRRGYGAAFGQCDLGGVAVGGRRTQRPRFEHDDVTTCLGQAMGGCECHHTAADDNDSHVLRNSLEEQGLGVRDRHRAEIEELGLSDNLRSRLGAQTSGVNSLDETRPKTSCC